MELAETLVVLLVIQVVLGLFVLVRINKGLYLQDIRMFVVGAFGLYSLFWPIVYLLFSSSVDNAFIETIVAYNLAIFGFNLITIIKKRSWPKETMMKKERNNYIILLLSLFLLVAFSFYFMYSKGVAVFRFGEGMTSRSEYSESLSQLWVVLSYTIAIFCNYLIFSFSNLGRKKKVLLLSIILFYILYQISLGNRSEYATIVFFSLCYYLCFKNKHLNLRLMVALAALFVFSFYITIFRDDNTRNLDNNETVELAMQSNEFIYPMQTTYYTIKNNWPLRFGETYFLLPIQIAIPRVLYPKKPDTLGGEFVEKTFGKGYMGFAYTPVTEAYLNFGILGPFLVYFILGLFLDKQICRIKKHGVDFKYLFLYGIVFNFSRGDFASIMYLVFISFLAYKLLCVLSKNSRNKAIVK